MNIRLEADLTEVAQPSEARATDRCADEEVQPSHRPSTRHITDDEEIKRVLRIRSPDSLLDRTFRAVTIAFGVLVTMCLAVAAYAWWRLIN